MKNFSILRVLGTVIGIVLLAVITLYYYQDIPRFVEKLDDPLQARKASTLELTQKIDVDNTGIVMSFPASATRERNDVSKQDVITLLDSEYTIGEGFGFAYNCGACFAVVDTITLSNGYQMKLAGNANNREVKGIDVLGLPLELPFTITKWSSDVKKNKVFDDFEIQLWKRILETAQPSSIQ